uniref:hypothetical protein n=1 Tax=Corynebacterium glutamicum TaxID=1718 RepID=UPI00155DC4D6|nr:hypothetical protein [Corynebacterium glutamicum]
MCGIFLGFLEKYENKKCVAVVKKFWLRVGQDFMMSNKEIFKKADTIRVQGCRRAIDVLQSEAEILFSTDYWHYDDSDVCSWLDSA